MKHFWNERFKTDEYVYGTEPNRYFSANLVKWKPGRILLPMEGEGRNAVFAAKKGWYVEACDYSEEARKKALDLAASRDVTISYELCDMTNPDLVFQNYDAAGLIFTHMAVEERKKLHRAVADALLPGGIIILEAFHKSQTGYDSGGPGNQELLYNAETIQSDFAGMKFLELVEKEVTLKEGPGHNGRAAVVRALIQTP